MPNITNMPSRTIKQFPLEEEYKKNTGITLQDVAMLRQWLATQPHLPGEYITDLDLILAYHSCDRSSEVTKQVLDLHYTLKTLFTNYFKNREVDSKIETVFRTVLIKPLPTRTKEGYAVLYTHLLDYDSKNFVFTDSLRTVLMVLDLWQYEEGTWPGFVLVADLQGITLGHLAKFDLHNIQQFLYFLQEAMLVKVKGFHFHNAPPFMDKLMMMLKPFMKKALLDVLNIHQVGSRTLEQFVSMDALPKEVGGSYMSLEECRDEILGKIKANQEFFKLENKKRVVESRRPGRAKTISDIFGSVEGSFKKLDID